MDTYPQATYVGLFIGNKWPLYKEGVRVDKHLTITVYPTDWAQQPKYDNWRNNLGQLCGFVEIEGSRGRKYLTSTVY